MSSYKNFNGILSTVLNQRDQDGCLLTDELLGKVILETTETFKQKDHRGDLQKFEDIRLGTPLLRRMLKKMELEHWKTPFIPSTLFKKRYMKAIIDIVLPILPSLIPPAKLHPAMKAAHLKLLKTGSRPFLQPLLNSKTFIPSLTSNLAKYLTHHLAKSRKSLKSREPQSPGTTTPHTFSSQESFASQAGSQSEALNMLKKRRKSPLPKFGIKRIR